MPNAERLRANAQTMDKRPFRGTSLRFTGRGNTPFLDFAHSREIWKEKDIAQIIEQARVRTPPNIPRSAEGIAAQGDRVREHAPQPDRARDR